MIEAAIKVSAIFEHNVSEISNIVGMMIMIGGSGFFAIGITLFLFSWPIKLEIKDARRTPGSATKLPTNVLFLPISECF